MKKNSEAKFLMQIAAYMVEILHLKRDLGPFFSSTDSFLLNINSKRRFYVHSKMLNVTF